jgi:muramidase (phage lysozyme)
MKSETLPNTYLPPTEGRPAPEAADAYSSTGHAPVLGGAGRRGVVRAAFAACVFLLVGLSGAGVALAKPGHKVERLRAAYALDESVEESDGGLIRRKLFRLLSRADVRLFLKVIRTAEAGEPDLMVGGCRAPNLKKHPALQLPYSCRYLVKGLGRSSASGNYQLTLENWKKIAPFLKLRDFSETNQALATLELIRRGGGAADPHTDKGFAMKRRIQGGFLKLLLGDLDSALCMATQDWASSSCSTLPAANRVVYARLATDIRKEETARRGETRARLQLTRSGVEGKGGRVKATLKLSRRAPEATPPRTKVRKTLRARAR